MSISIAIPFYNAEKFLPDAIRSVFAQTFQEWELILIDDGSTDGSLEIAQSINDPRVRVLADGKNKKLAGRLNQVVELVKYDYIARMDADDIMDPRRLQIQYDILENTDYDLTTTGLYSIKNDLTLAGMRGVEFSDKLSVKDVINRKVEILHASVLARKSWYERNRYDESLPVAQDYDLWLGAASREDLKIKIVSDPLYVYREEGNVTVQKLLKAYGLTSRIIEKYNVDKQFAKKQILNSKIKSFIVKMLDKFDLLHHLHNKRNQLQLVDEENIKDYSKMLRRIQETQVPGLVDKNFRDFPKEATGDSNYN
ncbi:Glycosyltransferase involved in cell wall bisynthesis [Salegentibacter echinorum]|uniref:Glycosyltransferase involved in cell wall bisynthesis n=1 Tax=Salegentibacter echinorum TaxID=1073325 RepID=A0A1M5BVQ9_SALEC|nr:glycosyltransferase family 2 protein [Salegentibacter echinorum]SHF46367.1 Glycosyltransferase involved in cell wall bisynthesis [Salegentibacter echinorum]